MASSAEGVGGKKRRKSRQTRSDGSFVRSSGDDTEQQVWGSLRDAESCSRLSAQTLSVPLKRSNSSPNISMASSRSSPFHRRMGDSSQVRDSARQVRSDSIVGASDDVRPQYLLPSKEAERTVDLSLRPKQGGSEPQSWRRALESSGKGKVDASRSELSSSSFTHGYLCDLPAVDRSVNCSVDSAASMQYCHARRNIFSAPPARRSDGSEGSSKAPLLQPPTQQAVLHCSSGGDLLICSTGGDVTFFTVVDTAPSPGAASPTPSSVLLRISVRQRNRTKVSVCRASREMAPEYDRILEESLPTMGFTFLSPTESDSIVNNSICAPSTAERTYSLRDVPGWIIPKYNKIARILDSVKCRIPKLILYVSSQAALRTRRSETNKGSSASPTSERTRRSVYCKCMLMSNDPLPDFCVQWADGVKLRYSLESGRLHLSSHNDPPRMPLYQWDDNDTSASESGQSPNRPRQAGVPSWTATAPDSVKEYLLVAQLAMQRCLEEKDSYCNSCSETGVTRKSENERMVFI